MTHCWDSWLFQQARTHEVHRLFLPRLFSFPTQSTSLLSGHLSQAQRPRAKLQVRSELQLEPKSQLPEPANQLLVNKSALVSGVV